MRAINHYLFFGGENHPVLSAIKRHDWGPPVRKDGSLRPHYHRYPKLSKALAAYGEALTLAIPETVSSIGFQLDYFMTEVNTDATLQAAKTITHQRDSILFDFFARGLAISNRPFDAIDLDRQDLDVTEHPVLWVMMEKQCHPSTQNKLVDYVRNGGNLVMAGRMCTEDFYHNPCTILVDAIGIKHLNTAQPFQRRDITIFNHNDVPVSFIETYEGDFDGVFAKDEDNATIGFIKNLGKGKIFMLGASISVVSLVELDILEQLANHVNCPVLLKMTDWVDARISVGEAGSFLFINNYKDDPIDTIVTKEDQSLTKAHAIHVPARQGVILPIEWHLNDQVLIHYITSEIRQIIMNDDCLVLETAEKSCAAEITLKGYSCDNAVLIEDLEGAKRVEVVSNTGEIVLNKAS
jgi:beta-galactosidase